jgi:diguanylate cyclase (GGDEF)-like protein
MEKAPQPAYALTAHPETTRLPQLEDNVFFPESAKDVAIMLLLAAVYFVAGKMGLRLAFVNSSATAVWPPTGIALAAFLIWGYRMWPGILLGAFLVNLTTTGTIGTSLGIALGNTLEGLAGSWLVNRFAGGRKAFHRAQDVFRFALFALFATSLAATVGATTLSLGGLAHWIDYGTIWLTWWLGDAAGGVVVAPLLVLWVARPRLRWNGNAAVEALALFLCLYVVAQTVFGGLIPLGRNNYPLEFLCLPFLIWAAFRLGPRGAALATVVLSAIAIRGTLSGFGPFAREAPNESLLLLQAFIGVSGVMTLALAALVLERKQHEEALEVLAVSDSLTGLANYRRLVAALQMEIERCERTERVFALLLLDLDGLKKVNDRFGHLVGSRAICRVAETLRDTCRALDTPARFGGDEFAVLLPETDEAEAQQVAGRIVERLAADKENPRISVSLGASLYPRDGTTPETLLEAADKALYQMKRTNGGARRQRRTGVEL